MPALDLAATHAHLAHLVDELGPRPFGSTEEAAAASYVRAQLEGAGWSVRSIGRSPNQVACRGTGRRLLLAHIDSVAQSPGAVDNAAAVAVLLELARTSPAADLCVAFPDGEEVGLEGSADLARSLSAWHPQPEALELVVSTELLGQGDVAVMGLGRHWGDARLQWLADTLEPAPQVPFPYRVYSRVYPQGERSDHAPFAVLLDLPSMLVFGRAPGGAFTGYHQPTDTAVDDAALQAAAATLHALAAAPALPAPGGGLPDASTLLGGVRLPSWLSWLAILGGLGSAAADWRRVREVPAQLLRFVAASTAAAAVMVPWVALGLFDPAPAERTAAAIMGMPASGWWTGAGPAAVSAVVAFVGVRRLLGPRGSAPLAAGVLTGAMLPVDPLLAAFFGLSAVLARVHPLLSALPVLYLVQPEILREFSFHGLVPPTLWGLAWVLAWPAVGRYPSRAARPPATAPEAA